MIAHVPGQNDMLLGRFIPQNANQQTVACDANGVNNDASVGHSNPDPSQDFQSMQLMWQAPSDADGMVDFRYYINTAKLRDIYKFCHLCLCTHS